MEQTVEKKKRAPRSEESKQKTRESMKARAEKLRQENGGVAATPETREKMKANAGEKSAHSKMTRLDGTKATKLVVSLLDFVNDIRCAQDNQGNLDALQEAFPEMKWQWSKNGTEIEFSRSSTEIRKEFGVIGLDIWKKVFKCVQQGGYSDTLHVGFPSVWALNEADWFAFTIRKTKIQGKIGRQHIVYAFMTALTENEEYKRVGTELTIDTKMGVKQIVAKQKRMTTKAEREQIAIEREAMKKEHNVEPAGNYRKVFEAKKKAHEKAVAASRALAQQEKEAA